MTRLLPALALGTAAFLLMRARQQTPYSLAGKVVLITGGSRGLGLVLARACAAEGAKLALCARDAGDLETVRQELQGRGAEVLTVVADVTREADARQVVQQTLDQYGRLDVLINNAAQLTVGPLEEMTLEDYREAMDTNLFGPLHFMLAARGPMERQGGGRIVNISSIGGKVSVPHLVPYSASKFALTGLSGGWRSELARKKIVVTTVHPGLIATGAARNTDVKGQHTQEYAWFAVADHLPGLAQSAEACAAEILAALKAGRAEIVTSVPGKLLALAHSLFPGGVTDLNTLSARLLPGPAGVGGGKRKGSESESALTRALPGKRAAEQANNER